MKTKQMLMQLARHMGLLQWADRGRFHWRVRQQEAANTALRQRHPELKLPPPYLVYETQGYVDYEGYLASGQRAALGLLDCVGRLFPDRQPLSICEWGCGPARVMRWLAQFDVDGQLFLCASDYDPATIRWCADSFPRIDFRLNKMSPPAPFADNTFDLLYSLSVYTHLSEEMHYAWLADNLRVVRAGGYVIMSVHGDAASDRLLAAEQARYRSGELVVRDGASEGSRTYVAYQSPRFMRERFLRGLEIVEHIPQPTFTGQELWIVRKPMA